MVSQTYNNKKNLKYDFVSGWIGGSLGILLTHPIDTVRVRMQYASQSPYSNITYRHVIQNIHRTIGIKGIFRGVLPPMALRGFSMALNRTGYNFGHSIKSNNNVINKYSKIGLVGSFSGLCQSIGDAPLYILKCRAQTTGRKKMDESFSTYIKMAKEITRREGIRGWLNGFIPCSLCCMSSYAIFYPLYEYFLTKDMNAGLAGAISATICWPIALPFDTLRVRMQCQSYHVPLTKAVKQMWRQPISKWYIGMSATLVRAFPRYGICMGTIEYSKHFL
tara:strand:+ start:620 stop:1450 length:831 start_codon:yes stop_codon:yes gene_type:complete